MLLKKEKNKIKRQKPKKINLLNVKKKVLNIGIKKIDYIDLINLNNLKKLKILVKNLIFFQLFMLEK